MKNADTSGAGGKSQVQHQRRWAELIEEHLERDTASGRREYLVKSKQTVDVVCDDRLIEAGFADGYVFEVLDDSLYLRNLNPGEDSPRIPWDEIKEMSFAYSAT
jgi:hypothetical protein